MHDNHGPHHGPHHGPYGGPYGGPGPRGPYGGRYDRGYGFFGGRSPYRSPYAGTPPKNYVRGFTLFKDFKEGYRYGLQKYKNPIGGVLYGFFGPFMEIGKDVVDYRAECKVKKDLELLELNLTRDNIDIVEGNIELLRDESKRKVFKQELEKLRSQCTEPEQTNTRSLW